MATMPSILDNHHAACRHRDALHCYCGNFISNFKGGAHDHVVSFKERPQLPGQPVDKFQAQ